MEYTGNVTTIALVPTVVTIYGAYRILPKVNVGRLSTDEGAGTQNASAENQDRANKAAWMRRASLQRH
jgi:hypothetical protein